MVAFVIEKISRGGSNERKICLDIIREEKEVSIAILGRAVAHAVSQWLPTAAVRVRARVWSCEILWWTEWRWGRFSPSTSVSLLIFIPPIAPKSPPSIIWGWYNRPVVVAVPSGLSLTPLRIIIKIHDHIRVKKD
jgi:hypothetical protein